MTAGERGAHSEQSGVNEDERGVSEERGVHPEERGVNPEERKPAGGAMTSMREPAAGNLTMRAAVYAPETGLLVQEVALPVVKPGEALLKVTACGVCGSDRHVVSGGQAPFGTAFPVILGHEIAGRIVAFGPAADAQGSRDAAVEVGRAAAVGAGAVQAARTGEPGGVGSRSNLNYSQFAVGDNVVVHPYLSCQSCSTCRAGQPELCPRQEVIGYHRSGGYAEYVAVPISTLCLCPPGLSPAAAALVVDAFATPYHALSRTLQAESADSGGSSGSSGNLLVIGTGGLALAAVMLAEAMGVSQVGVLSRSESGVERAKRAGVEAAWSLADLRATGRQVRRWSQGGVDMVLDTIGSAQSIRAAMEFTRAGGRVAIIGISEDAAALPLSAWVRRGITVAGSYGSTIDEVRTLLDWAATGRLDVARLLGDALPLERIGEAFSGNRTGERAEGRAQGETGRADGGGQDGTGRAEGRVAIVFEG